MAWSIRSLGRPRAERTPGSLAVAVVVVLAISGCAGLSASNRSGNALVLYSAQHPETTSAIVAVFTKQTGIKVLVKNDSEDVLTAQLEQEGSRSPADCAGVQTLRVRQSSL